MMFGKTTEEKERKRVEKLWRQIFGIREFCLLPKKLHNGRYAWLTYVYTYYGAYKDEHGISLCNDGYKVSSLIEDDSLVKIYGRGEARPPRKE